VVIAGLILVAAVPALVAIAPVFARRQRNEDFIPKEEVALKALEAYLAAWQRGEPVQPVLNTSPGVVGADGLQAAGKKLESYTILGPVAADAPRCFAVRLKIAGTAEELRERYVVIGLDPLWVLRYDDYEMLMHWEHPMPPPKKPSS
jgi:hypothetical protein